MDNKTHTIKQGSCLPLNHYFGPVEEIERSFRAAWPEGVLPEDLLCTIYSTPNHPDVFAITASVSESTVELNKQVVNMLGYIAVHSFVISCVSSVLVLNVITNDKAPVESGSPKRGNLSLVSD